MPGVVVCTPRPPHGRLGDRRRIAWGGRPEPHLIDMRSSARQACHQSWGK